MDPFSIILRRWRLFNKSDLQGCVCQINKQHWIPFFISLKSVKKLSCDFKNGGVLLNCYRSTSGSLEWPVICFTNTPISFYHRFTCRLLIWQSVTVCQVTGRRMFSFFEEMSFQNMATDSDDKIPLVYDF